MAKLFNIDDDVVVATVMKCIPRGGYFFVQNGEPRQIFCHVSNGGFLDVTDRGEILLNHQTMDIPCKGKKVALVRASDKIENPLHFKAEMWVPLEQWKQCSDYVDKLCSTYRVVAYNHMINNAPAENNAEDIVWAEGILKDLIKEVKGGRIDINGQTCATEISGLIFASHIGWQRQVNGKWFDCHCPLPRHLQR